MRWEDFPLPDGSYSDDTRPWSQQDVVNYLPTFAELPGTRSRLKLEPVPGLKPYAVVGDGPHRGARDVEGRAFVVSGNQLYRVSATGVAIPIGTIPGTGLVSMTHNQIAGGNQLVIGTRDNSYVYDTVTDTLTATGVGLSSVDFLGQMILGVSTDRRFWRHSALADAKTYSELDVYSAESAPDRIVGGIASQSEWLAFGERTIETFVNSPTENAAFQRMTGAVVEKGCANGNTIRRLDNSVFWLGDDLIVYRMQGYQPVPISTKAMATAFRACDPAKAFAFTYEDHGYVVYYLSFQDGQTWGYDVTNQRWHRRESFGLDRWRLNTLFKSNGEWYGGDYSNGNLYKLEWGYMLEGESAVLPRRLRSGVMHSNGNRVFVHALRMLIDSGLPPSAPGDFPGQPEGPTISGEAPDALTDEPYSFAYTTTAGDAPISRTVLRDTTLPAGWVWNESTATISYPDTPVPVGVIDLNMRSYDTNGLYDDHTDRFVIAQEYTLLVTGAAKTTGGPLVASATALTALDFEGIAQSSGADVIGTPGHYDGQWVIAGDKTARIATDVTSWTTISSALNCLGWLAGGEDGWVLRGSGGSDISHKAAIAEQPPTEFVEWSFATESPPGTTFRAEGVGNNILNAKFAGGNYWMDSNSGGELVKTATLGGTPMQLAGAYRPNGIATFHDVAEWGGALYATVTWDAIQTRHQLRRSNDGGVTWPDILIDYAAGDVRAPSNIACNDDILVCLDSLNSHLWTSADDFAVAHETGVTISGSASGRQIVAAAERFFIIGKTTGENACVCVPTVDGLTFGTPGALPVDSVRGIAAGAVT